MILSRSLHFGEPDLLIGFENTELMIKDLDGNNLKRITPQEPWTHRTLESLDFSEFETIGYNVFLGTQWIGGSEV